MNPGYTRYELAQSPDNFVTAALISTPVAIGANLTGYSWPISGLQPGTPYYFHVRAFNGQASDYSGTVFSDPVDITGLTTPGPPSISASASVAVSPTSIYWAGLRCPAPTGTTYTKPKMEEG